MRIWTVSLCCLFLLPAYASAQINGGKALLLDGLDDYVCTLLRPPVADAITISAWIKTPGAGTIIGNHYHGASWESVELVVSAFIINSSNSEATRQLALIPDADDDQWHHVAGVWDGEQVTVYVDGSQVGGPLPAPNPPWQSAQPFWIGARESLTTPPISNGFVGLLDEVRVWTVARSQEEIQSTMADTLGPEYYANPGSGLFAYWRFDELEDLGMKEPGVNDVREFTAQEGHGELVGGSLVEAMTSGIAPSNQPLVLDLDGSFPNPFRDAQTIRYRLTEGTAVDLAVFTVQGRRVATLVRSYQDAGVHSLTWDGRNDQGTKLSAGIYALRWSTSSGGSGSGRVTIVR